MSARALQHSLAPFLVACLGIALFSAMDAVMKGLSLAIGAYNAMLWRSLAGLILTFPLFLLTRRGWPDRRTLALHLWRGLAAAISVLLFFIGLTRMPLAEGIALSFIAPLIALALAALFLKERIGANALGGSALAFAGVIAIVANRTQADDSQDALTGTLAILAAAIFYAVNLVLSRRQSQAAGPLEIVAFFNLVALCLYGLGAPWLAAPPAPGLIVQIVLAAITSSLSLMLLAWAYARAETQHLVSVEYTAFLWASLFGWLVFGEALGPATLAGAAMIVAGCLVAARTGRASTPPSRDIAP
jgi:S-adenosylmethionine uptake transporter